MDRPPLVRRGLGSLMTSAVEAAAKEIKFLGCGRNHHNCLGPHQQQPLHPLCSLTFPWWWNLLHYLPHDVLALLLTLVYFQQVVIVVGAVRSVSLRGRIIHHQEELLIAESQDIICAKSWVRGIIKILIPVYERVMRYTDVASSGFNVIDLVMVSTSACKEYIVYKSTLYSSGKTRRFISPYLLEVPVALERCSCFIWLANVTIPLWCWPSSKILLPSLHSSKTDFYVPLIVSCYSQGYGKISELLSKPRIPQGLKKC